MLMPAIQATLTTTKLSEAMRGTTWQGHGGGCLGKYHLSGKQDALHGNLSHHINDFIINET